MRASDEFEDAYEAASAHASASAASARAEQYVTEVQSSLDDALRLLQEIAAECGNAPLDSLKGFLAEGWHAATFNVDAARQRLQDQFRAEVLHLNTFRSPDVRIHTPSGVHDFQLKYYKTGAETGKQLSDPLFREMGKVAPSDQIHALKEAVTRRAERIADHRPEQPAELLDTANRVSGRVSVDGVASRPLAHDQARELARSARDGDLDQQSTRLTVEETLTAADAVRETATAAATAAVLSAAFSAAPHVAAALRAWLADGDNEEVHARIRQALAAGGRGAAAGGLRGAVAAGLTLAARSGALGEAAKSLSGSTIGALTALAIQGAADTWAYRNGQITGAELAARTSRNVAAAGGAAVGAAVGQTVIPIPVLGAVVGSVVGATLASTAHGGVLAGLARLENREGWEAQVELARSVVQLATSLKVAMVGTVMVVRQQEIEIEQFAVALSAWNASDAATRDHLARAAGARAEAKARLAGMNRRLSARRLGAPPENPDRGRE